MSDYIEQALRKLPLLTQGDPTAQLRRLHEYINREVFPVLNQLRGSVNRRWGSRVTTGTGITMALDEEMVFCSVASETITLPSAVLRKGPLYVVNTSGAGTVTVAAASGEEVDGAASVTVSAGQAFISDGSGWWSS